MVGLERHPDQEGGRVKANQVMVKSYRRVPILASWGRGWEATCRGRGCDRHFSEAPLLFRKPPRCNQGGKASSRHLSLPLNTPMARKQTSCLEEAISASALRRI